MPQTQAPFSLVHVLWLTFLANPDLGIIMVSHKRGGTCPSPRWKSVSFDPMGISAPHPETFDQEIIYNSCSKMVEEHFIPWSSPQKSLRYKLDSTPCPEHDEETTPLFHENRKCCILWQSPWKPSRCRDWPGTSFYGLLRQIQWKGRPLLCSYWRRRRRKSIPFPCTHRKLPKPFSWRRMGEAFLLVLTGQGGEKKLSSLWRKGEISVTHQGSWCILKIVMLSYSNYAWSDSLDFIMPFCYRWPRQYHDQQPSWQLLLRHTEETCMYCDS